jgi:hypothetical protein
MEKNRQLLAVVLLADDLGHFLHSQQSGVRGAGAEAACKKLAKFGWFIRGDGSKFGYMVHREFALKG